MRVSFEIKLVGYFNLCILLRDEQSVYNKKKYIYIYVYISGDPKKKKLTSAMTFLLQRFTQYLASSNSTFQLSNFLDKSGVQGDHNV